jgi:hypothetical protein
MQQYVTPQPGRTPPEPNIVNRDDYKMHILKRQYHDGEWEILIERWIPETGWTRTQILCDTEHLAKIQAVLAA